MRSFFNAVMILLISILTLFLSNCSSYTDNKLSKWFESNEKIIAASDWQSGGYGIGDAPKYASNTVKQILKKLSFNKIADNTANYDNEILLLTFYPFISEKEFKNLNRLSITIKDSSIRLREVKNNVYKKPVYECIDSNSALILSSFCLNSKKNGLNVNLSELKDIKLLAGYKNDAFITLDECNNIFNDVINKNWLLLDEKETNTALKEKISKAESATILTGEFANTKDKIFFHLLNKYLLINDSKNIYVYILK